MPLTPEVLDQLLEHASAGPGLSILTTNPHRLQIALVSRMREHRKAHPEAYRQLSIISSKSPKELYLVNREAAGRPKAPLPGGESEADSEPPDGLERLALPDLSAERDGLESSPSPPRNTPEQNQ